jgi:hypothetical protein
VAAIREKILGPTGSQLSIILESAANGELYQRVLTRGAVQQEAQTMNYASSVGAPSLTQLPSTVGTLTRSLGNVSVVPLAGSNDSEIARLKRRIAELEAHVGMADSENQRLRAMLDQERRYMLFRERELSFSPKQNQALFLWFQRLGRTARTALTDGKCARRERIIDRQDTHSMHSFFNLSRGGVDA